MKKILIIGGTGFIGSFLVRKLTDLGHEVAVFNRGNNKHNVPSNITHFIGEKDQILDYKHEFIRFAPQIVIHMIAYTEQDAQNAMKTFDGIAERMVVLSSMDVYQAYGNLIKIENVPTVPIPFNEDAPLRKKLHPYGGDYEKQLVEKVIMGNSANLPGTILRLPMVYGEGDSSHRLYKYVKRMIDGRRDIILDEVFAKWRSSHGYVGNVAHAITLAALNDTAKDRIYNVGDEISLTERQWVQRIAKAMEWNGKIHSIPRVDLPEQLIYSLLDLKQDWVTDTSRIRKELKYKELYSIDDAIKRTVAWEANNPPKELHPKDFPRFDYDFEDTYLESLS